MADNKGGYSNMGKQKIKYKEIKEGKYRYELLEKYTCKTSIPKSVTAKIPGYVLIKNGFITISKGYRWDGATGINGIYPNKWVLAGSLPHDAGYQAIREKKLYSGFRTELDDDLYKDFIEDGMPKALAIPSIAVVRAVGWIFI